MATIYLSSTYSDLQDYRDAVYRTLRQMRYDVLAMEDYTATHQRPLHKCLSDVATCDLYIGIIAWRYGYIPPEENPQQLSITELEYRTAVEKNIPCLLFLLADDAAWPRSLMDEVTGEGDQGLRISALRQEFRQEKTVSFFTSSEHLARLVGSAVHLWEKTYTQAEREERLRAMLADHNGFLRDRLNSFVGRQRELAEIQKRIAELLPTGGYITITGQAGQGKSSIIARLIEIYGIEERAFHFIPINPGPDHQVGLLRNLMARLLLKYQLSDLYLASESRPALRDYFAKVLAEIEAKGGQEIIFLDGLDQLEEELSGSRDLSFLPTKPPPGIVFVLGTRPNDTLRPLELLKPHQEYRLPNLSRQDFDLILQRRHVHLDTMLADQFYQVMQENALYLTLVAGELAENGALAAVDMIQQMSDNPNNLFSLSIERLRRQSTEWNEIILPILGVLLVAREPLAKRHIRQILELREQKTVREHRLNDGLERLGGLITEDGQQHYSLFHLKLREYLRQDESRPHKHYIFAQDEEEDWQKTLARWCEQKQSGPRGTGALELERQSYASQYYITHLYLAREWQELFTVLDKGIYGQTKIRNDPSTRSYVQDLDLGRQATVWAEWDREESIALLPHLWRYTLLRCSLTSQADRYSLAAFELLLQLKREQQAIGLVELLTDPIHKTRVLLYIAKYLKEQVWKQHESIQLLVRAREIAQTIEDHITRAWALHELSSAYAQAKLWEQAEELTRAIEDQTTRAEAMFDLSGAYAQTQHWDQAEAIIRAIEDDNTRFSALLNLGTAYAQAQLLEYAHMTWIKAETLIPTTEGSYIQALALRRLGIAYAQAQFLDEAQMVWTRTEAVIGTIEDHYTRARALHRLSSAYAQVQFWEQAETIARAIEVDTILAEALHDLSIAYAQAQLWMQAETLILHIEVSATMTEALLDLSTAYLQAQMLERADELIHFIEDDSVRIKALMELGIAYTQAQLPQRADAVWVEVEQEVYAIKDHDIKVWSLYDLGKAYAQAQFLTQAQTVWADAETLIRATYQSAVRIDALRDLSEAYVEAQLWEQAKTLWDETEELISMMQEKRLQGNALRDQVVVYVKAQAWERAETLIQAIKNNDMRTRVLLEMGSACGRQELWERLKIIWTETEALLRTINDSHTQSRALFTLFDCYIQAQLWEPAQALLPALEGHDIQMRALRMLGSAFHQVQRQKEAEAIWTEIEKLIATIENKETYIAALLELSHTYIQLSQWERAEALSAFIEDNNIKVIATRELAYAYISRQYWERAEKLIKSIEDREVRITTLCDLGAAYAQAQLIEPAKVLWAEAHTLAASTDSASYLAILRKLGTSYAQSQLWNEVGKIREEIKAIQNAMGISSEQADDAYDLSMTCIQAQLWEQAEEFIHTIQDLSVRIKAWQDLGVAYMQADLQDRAFSAWEQAETLLQAIHSDLERSEQLNKLVATYMQAHCWERVEALIPSIEDRKAYVKTLIDLGAAYNEAQFPDRARTTWNKVEEDIYAIQDSEARNNALLDLSIGYIRAQEWDHARKLIHSINDQDRCTTALLRLSQEYAHASLWESAETIAYTIEASEERAIALNDIAYMMAQRHAYEDLLHVVQRSWMQAKTREDAIRLLPLVCSLLTIHPEIGQELSEGFVWVNAFLQGKTITQSILQ